MGKQAHVGRINRDSVRELLGPAEAQYQVSFTDDLATNPGNQTCENVYDTYTFTLNEPAGQLCLNIESTGGPMATGAALFAQLCSVSECVGYPAYATVTAGSASAEYCYADIPAGDYLVLITATGVTRPFPYAMAIDASVPVSGAVQDLDDVCSLVICP